MCLKIVFTFPSVYHSTNGISYAKTGYPILLYALTCSIALLLDGDSLCNTDLFVRHACTGNALHFRYERYVSTGDLPILVMPA